MKGTDIYPTTVQSQTLAPELERFTEHFQTDAALEAGILAPVHSILKTSPVANLRKEAAWALSNICAGTKEQIQKVLDEGILQTLIEVIDTVREKN